MNLISVKRRLARPVAGMAGAALAAAVIVVATTAPESLAASTHSPGIDNGQLISAVTPSEQETITAKYGVYPLPITPAAIEQFHITNAELPEIAQAHAFAETPKARSVRTCESDNDYTITDRAYYGAWQFDRQTWVANGGGRFAPTANLAPLWAQDFIMWKTHQAYGWGPWSCA